MKPEKRLFLTGTMRTGGSLLITMLSAHSKILILNERVHFFRFVYDRYNPLNAENTERLLRKQAARLRHRNNADFDVDGIFRAIQRRGFTYKNIYDEMMCHFMKMADRSIWGEFAALQWREIPIYLDLFPAGKAIHMYRDPRGVLSSWKKLSSIPNNAYLNAIFNWVDSANHVKHYQETLGKDRYYAVRYEDIMADPEKEVRSICQFIDVEFEPELMQPETWPERFNTSLVKVPRSAHEGSGILGFSTQRTDNWRKHLENWELALVDVLAGSQIADAGYSQAQKAYTPDEFQKGLTLMQQNPLLLENLITFLTTGQGVDTYPMDPTDPNSWGAPHNPSEWFTESPAAEPYFRDLEKIEEYLNKKYNEQSAL
ncbi:MAG: hypothetical protein CMM52_16520 [Rhodospirillaceae bacterium]|nr:hypothetical protein [Rhodospirillaceae bacterium]|tara:strand:- start:620 stop:1732 length:1113 start_codon:yes stop_codon:yes gene_type:complete